MLPGIGPMELIVVLVIALIVFGPRSSRISAAHSAAGCASSRTRSPATATARSCPRPIRRRPKSRKRMQSTMRRISPSTTRAAAGRRPSGRAPLRLVVALAASAWFGLTTWRSDRARDPHRAASRRPRADHAWIIRAVRHVSSEGQADCGVSAAASVGGCRGNPPGAGGVAGEPADSMKAGAFGADSRLRGRQGVAVEL